MFAVTVEATSEPDAIGIAERRARDAGYRVLTVDEVVLVDTASPSHVLRRWWIRLAVALR